MLTWDLQTMTSNLKQKTIPTEVQVSKGRAYSFAWGLIGLVVSCSAMQGNVDATLTGAGVAGAAGFAYGIATTTQKDVKAYNDRQKRIREENERSTRELNEYIRKQNEFTTQLNRPKRLVPVERLSPEQIDNFNLLVKSLEVWDDVLKTASGVSRIAVGTYVLELQKIRREVAHLDWSDSFISVRDALIVYMDSVINKFHDFQADRIGWRWTNEIEKHRKYIYLTLELVGVMEPC